MIFFKDLVVNGCTRSFIAYFQFLFFVLVPTEIDEVRSELFIVYTYDLH